MATLERPYVITAVQLLLIITVTITETNILKRRLHFMKTSKTYSSLGGKLYECFGFLFFGFCFFNFRKYEKWGRKEIQKRCYSESYENSHILIDCLAEKKTTLLVQTNILFELN